MRKVLLVSVALSIGALSGGVVVGYYRARSIARENTSRCRFAQLELALLNYYDVYKRFPPRVVKDEHGKPVHSWRVLLMPYISSPDTYVSYDFEQPWNAPANAALRNDFARGFFGCREGLAQGTAQDAYRTRYVAVTPEDGQWPRRGPLKAYLVKVEQSQFLLIELLDSDIHWMEPRDQ